MAIIAGFRSTNVWKAFVLNSLVASLVIVFAVLVKESGEKRTVQYKDPDTEQTITLRQQYEWSWSNVARTIASAFLASMLAYTIMYFLFGYGGGLLVDT